MILADASRYALHAITSHRLRSFLTLLGIAVGIAAVILLTSIGEGVHRFVLAEFTQFGTNVIGISPGKVKTGGQPPSGIPSTARLLTLEDAASVKQLPHVTGTTPIVWGNSEVEGNGRLRRTTVYGVDAYFPRVFSSTVRIGSFLPNEDASGARAFVVLGSKLRNELFGTTNPLGARVRIGGLHFRVIGVMAPKGQFLGIDLDDTAFVPAARAMEVYNREGLMEVDVTYAEGVPASTVAAAIKAHMKLRHGSEDFTITTQEDMLKTLSNILDILTMAVGARLLAKKQAIVSRLVAIEELAGVDILCTDKTGTLTQNKLTLGDPFAVEGVPVDRVILDAALASRADDNDTIDLAVLGGLASGQALRGYHVEHFQPFEPVGKRTEATVRAADGSSFKVTKGAPQVILELSANAEQVKASVDHAVDDFAVRGFRSLGVARAEGDGAWRFLGVLPLFDPPRVDAKATIATALQMGVEVKMVTGDALAIASETAKTLGMGTDILDAASLGDTKRTESAVTATTIENADGYAQVFPEHKYHIVDVLQRRGHIVGMTGDGVNDAPALKKADCGIAVSGATDAARAAASIVLTTPGLSVIIDAIKESRKIFQRMNSYAIYRIAETLRVLLFMTLAIVVFNFFPVTAIMIVMLALLNDAAILSIAYDNVRARNQPEAWDMRSVLTIATVLGLVGPIAAFGLFYLGEKVLHIDRPQLQTMMYLLLSVAGHLTIFQTRTRGAWWTVRPSRILLSAVFGTQVVATCICLFGFLVAPLWWGWAALVWGYALAWFLLTDPIKLLAYRYLEATKPAAPQRQDQPRQAGSKPPAAMSHAAE